MSSRQRKANSYWYSVEWEDETAPFLPDRSFKLNELYDVEPYDDVDDEEEEEEEEDDVSFNLANLATVDKDKRIGTRVCREKHGVWFYGKVSSLVKKWNQNTYIVDWEEDAAPFAPGQSLQTSELFSRLTTRELRILTTNAR